MMANSLNPLPARVPIGKAGLVDVLMTPEFARAWTDLINRIGTNGLSNDDLAALASSNEGAGQVLALHAEIQALRALGELTTPTTALYQQIEELRNELALIENPAAQVRYIQTRYAPLLSPKFTGTPTAPTAAVGTNTTQLATTEFAQNLAATKQGKLDAVTVTGSRGGNAALTSLLTGLATQGLIINNTTA